MHTFFRSRAKSFGHAFAGAWYLIRTQKNAWIHTTATVVALGLAIWLGLPARDLAVLVVVIGLVWMAEYFNTSIEALVDLASPQNHPLAKISKDVGAGAVLVAAITSILVGLLILGPPLWLRISILLAR